MISDFSQLSDKVNQLAELVISLRSENIALQKFAVSVTVDNADLTRRMQEARDRVATLMDRLPAEPEIEAHDVEEAP